MLDRPRASNDREETRPKDIECPTQVRGGNEVGFLGRFRANCIECGIRINEIAQPEEEPCGALDQLSQPSRAHG